MRSRVLKSLVFTSALAAASLGVTACGTSATGQSSTGPLQFWSNHPGSSKAIEEAIIAEWNAANPDIPVQLIDGGSNYEELGQKFNAALAASIDAIYKASIT